MTLLNGEDDARAFVASRCSKTDFERIETFVGLLVQANQKQNLVSRQSLSQIWLRHVADSAQLLDYVSRETGRWLDLGSGAGFPGLVVAVMRPAQEFILVESRKRRAEWLEEATEALEVTNCTIEWSDVKKVQLSKVAVISARAFAPLERLIAQSARFSTATTAWVLPKGRSASQEVASLPSYQRSMFHVKQSVTDAAAGIVVGIGKVEVAL